MATKKSVKSIDLKKKKFPNGKSATDIKNTSSAKKDSPRKSMISQFITILNDLNEESLLFLIRQAQILQYNMNADKINTRKTGGSQKKTTPAYDKHTIEIIEGENNRDFIIAINNARNFFNLDEMKKIVKICYVSQNTTEAAAGLYQWFAKFRRDVIMDTKITSKNDPALETIYKSIINKYSVKN